MVPAAPFVDITVRNYGSFDFSDVVELRNAGGIPRDSDALTNHLPRQVKILGDLYPPSLRRSSS